MKKCPYCAEEIQDDAIKCRYCGEFLKKHKKWLNCFFGCLIALIVSIAAVILFIYFSLLLIKIVVYRIFFAAPGAPKYPFMGGGVEGMIQELAEIFRALWERILEIFRTGAAGYQRVTF